MRTRVPLALATALLTAVAACGGSDGAPQAGGGPGGGAPGGAGGRGGPRTPMTVEFATAGRAAMAEQIIVVGNLIGEATVQVVPRTNGRLQTVNVKLGDPVRRGQLLAKVEDREIQEQVRGAEASYQVSEATIRQRQADLKLAQTNLERSKSLYERQLLPQQSFDDVDARYQAALAQLDLARAQFEAAKARLDELKINLSNTVIVSPVDGFVGKRFLDPGAFASTNTPVVSVVAIRTVRMVANLVEKDMSRVPAGTKAIVEVDAFPGEKFTGQVSRVAPVFDPGTRTAEIEIEIPNGDFRLKPGMYSRVQLTVGQRADALTIPATALVMSEGRAGVFVPDAPAVTDGPSEGPAPAGAATSGSGAAPGGPGRGGPPGSMVVRFRPVQTGLRDGDRIEVTGGIDEGTRVITTGAGALKDGDRVLPANAGSRGGRAGEPAGGGRSEGARGAREGAAR
jgi:membrane fusion protein, multidrug efflux system